MSLKVNVEYMCICMLFLQIDSFTNRNRRPRPIETATIHLICNTDPIPQTPRPHPLLSNTPHGSHSRRPFVIVWLIDATRPVQFTLRAGFGLSGCWSSHNAYIMSEATIIGLSTTSWCWCEGLFQGHSNCTLPVNNYEIKGIAWGV